jgi:hypothetical protein
VRQSEVFFSERREVIMKRDILTERKINDFLAMASRLREFGGEAFCADEMSDDFNGCGERLMELSEEMTECLVEIEEELASEQLKSIFAQAKEV